MISTPSFSPLLQRHCLPRWLTCAQMLRRDRALDRNFLRFAWLLKAKQTSKKKTTIQDPSYRDLARVIIREVVSRRRWRMQLPQPGAITELRLAAFRKRSHRLTVFQAKAAELTTLPPCQTCNWFFGCSGCHLKGYWGVAGVFEVFL